MLRILEIFRREYGFDGDQDPALAERYDALIARTSNQALLERKFMASPGEWKEYTSNGCLRGSGAYGHA